MTTTLQDVREFIRKAGKADLDMVGDIITSRWKHLQAELAMNFQRGDKVYFISGKRDPRRIEGEVIETDGKWVYLATQSYPIGRNGWNYKVAPTLLKHLK